MRKLYIGQASLVNT